MTRFAARFSAAAVAALLALALLAGGAHAGRRDDGQAGPKRSDRGPAGWSPPAFCRGKDCPQFELVQSRDDVELRRYAPAHWISTNVSGTKWSDAYQEGYKRLQAYIQGGNEKAAALDQTNPSFTLFYTADVRARTLQGTYTIEYFVPFELQDAPPRPNATDVAVTRVEAQDVWVLSFGGFAAEEDVVQRGYDLLSNLSGDGVQVHTDFIGLALYDNPTRLLNRHNELWVWSSAKPSAANNVRVDAVGKRSASARAAASGARTATATATATAAAGEGGAEAAGAASRAFQDAWDEMAQRMRQVVQSAQQGRWP